jgi:hypothetical protein
MNGHQLAEELENAKSISEVAKLVKEKVIPALRQLQNDLFDLQKHIPIVEKKFTDKWWKDVANFNKAQEK